VREKRGEHPFGDAGQLISLGVFLVVWAGDSFLLRASTMLSGSVPPVVRLIALGLSLGAATCLAGSGHRVVGHQHRPENLVTDGAFRYVRHPLYLASLLTYAGLTMATVSLVSLALLLGVFVFHDYIAGYEERLLAARFGEEYERYRKRTGKWIPKLRRNP
jgi:protein-S-isoprenylcysteine O-methyltransferase Ste14